MQIARYKLQIRHILHISSQSIWIGNSTKQSLMDKPTDSRPITEFPSIAEPGG